eukprot:3630370-Pyramimonas_sp.AAC.1
MERGEGNRPCPPTWNPEPRVKFRVGHLAPGDGSGILDVHRGSEQASGVQHERGDAHDHLQVPFFCPRAGAVACAHRA